MAKPPAATYAESALLGAILAEPSWLAIVRDKLTPDDFYQPYNRAVYRAIVELADKGEFITADRRLCEPNLIASVIAANGDEKHFSQDPTVYLGACRCEHIKDPANAPQFLAQVRGAAMLRDFLATAEVCMREASAARVIEAEETLVSVQTKLDEVFRRHGESSVTHIGDRIDEVVEAMISDQRGITGVPTGFVDLDMLTSGLQRLEMGILGARPSHGKTSFALDIAMYAARQGCRVAIFSYEMAVKSLREHMVYTMARVEPLRSRGGTLAPEEAARMRDAAMRLRELPIVFDESKCHVQLLRAKAQRILKEEKRLDLIIVDYLQLVPAAPMPNGRRLPREQEIAEITRALKSIPTDLGVALLALAQVNRDVDRREDHHPIMADLRESGSMEQDADLILLMHRPAMYDADVKDTAKITIAKQRNGRTGAIELPFYSQFLTFTEANHV